MVFSGESGIKLYNTFLGKRGCTTQNLHRVFGGREVRGSEKSGSPGNSRLETEWLVKSEAETGRWSTRPDTRREGLTQPRHKVNIFPERYCELGIWLNISTEKQKGKHNIHILFRASEPTSLPYTCVCLNKEYLATSLWWFIPDHLQLGTLFHQQSIENEYHTGQRKWTMMRQ